MMRFQPCVAQPKGLAYLNKASQLNLGMFALTVPYQRYDLINRKFMTVVAAPLLRPAKGGIALNTDGSASYMYTPLPAPIVLTDWTLFQYFDTIQTTATLWMTCLGNSSNNNPLLGIISGNSTASKLRLFERDDNNVSTEADTTITVNDGNLHLVHLSCYTNASANRVVDCYVDGKFDTEVNFGASSGITFTIDRFTVGALLRATASNFWSGRTYIAGAAARAWSALEITQHVANPWQLFARPAYRAASGFATATNTLKTVNALPATNAKTIQKLARASVKTYDGLTPP